MTIQIPFNKEIFNKQITLNFNSVWKKNLKNNRMRIIWGIINFLVGGLLVYDENGIGFLFIGLGIHFFVNFYEFWRYYSKSKIRYFKNINLEIEGYQNSKQPCIWEFKDGYFGYADYKYETKIKWPTFKSFRIIEENLFLDFDSKNGISFILGKSEVDHTKWDEILKIVQEKINPISID